MRIVVAIVALFVLLGRPVAAEPLDWHDLPLPGLDGGSLDPEAFAGHVVLVVNTASLCGFTPQYEGLQALWETYRDRGLVVLGVPSDDFGGQEFADDGQIRQFCEITYGIDFPMLARQTVTGADAHPLFAWIGREAGSPRWNFHKYLVGRDGRLVSAYASATEPSSASLAEAIEGALASGS